MPVATKEGTKPKSNVEATQRLWRPRSENKGMSLFERKLWPTIKTGPTPVAQNQCCWHWRIGKIHTTLILGIHKLIGLVCCWGIYSSPLPWLYVYVGTELQCIDFRTSDIDIWTGFQAARYIDANLQQGHHHHQLILLGQGASSVSEPLSNWVVIKKQKQKLKARSSIAHLYWMWQCFFCLVK